MVDSEPLANRERAFIRDLIDKCQSKNQIKTALVAQFGPDVLATPEHKGFDLSAYWVPIVLGALALIGIVATAIKWRGKRRGSAEPGLVAGTNGSKASTDADDARLTADLETYDL